MSPASVLAAPSAGAALSRPLRSRAWAIVAALSVTETISWGVLYYSFAVFLAPMQAELGYSAGELTGAFSLALLVSALAGVAVGRYLDQNGPRALMTVGSIAGAALVLAWSQVDGLAEFYVVWSLLGLAMATVLYEPAFTVIAKHFHDPGDRRRAMTAMTLVGALASLIFLPVSQALIDAHGWRNALVALALALGATTIPLHAIVLRAPRADPHADPAVEDGARGRAADAQAALRSRSFRLLSAAFVLAAFASIAVTIHGIPFLVSRGHDPVFAAFAVGVAGASQIPGRLLFVPVAARCSLKRSSTAVFGLMALGITVTVAFDTTVTALAGLALLGIGNGMSTLLRATSMVDLYGPAVYGTVASVAAAATTLARAAGPLAAALFAVVAGYDVLLWALAALVVLAGGLARRIDT